MVKYCFSTNFETVSVKKQSWILVILVIGADEKNTSTFVGYLNICKYDTFPLFENYFNFERPAIELRS